ncbi:MAG: alpha/beta fold hydrolase [Steroidobacteraceae bacterium]
MKRNVSTRRSLLAFVLAGATLSHSALATQQGDTADSTQSPATVTPVNVPPPTTFYRTIEVDGLRVFYRDAGPRDAPVVLLLHGFPASSFMYRDLIARLASKYRVVAPDYPGFGYSDAPPTTQFSYTFDRLATFVEKFTDRLGLQQYALYMQDFGGPVGFRMASHRPERVSALIIQNANAYEAGLPESFWAPARALWKDPSAANFDRIRELAMSDAALEWNYTQGVREPERINPDSWILQRALLSRPGNKDAMLALLYDYGNNLAHYDAWQEYFRESQPPALIVWGKNDQIFPAEGASAYVRDLPRAELHLLDTGHFALEDKVDEIAGLITEFLDGTIRDGQ